MKSKNNQHAKSLGDGVTSFLSPYTDNLLSFIFEMRETGMAVSVNSIVLKASQLSREFREKTITARHSAMRRFINVHGFVHRMGTDLSQCQPSEMEEIATDFICVTQEKLQMSCRDEADRIPSTTPGAEPPRDAKDSGSARSHPTHLETSSSNRP